MKKHTLMILGIASVLLTSGCSKEIECLGTDCVFPEGIARIDSVVDIYVYTTLINREGDKFMYPLTLSPEVNREAFLAYVQSAGFEPDPGGEGEGWGLKTYYIAEDQSYITNDLEYINAFSCKLQIVAFGEDLH